MKVEKEFSILVILIVGLILFIIYPFTQVSNLQYSSFYGNIEDFDFTGKNCIVGLNAKDIGFMSEDFRIQSVRNITIENNGEQRFINYSPFLFVHNNHDFYLPLSNIGNIDVDILFNNLTMSKYSNSIMLKGDMSDNYANKFKLKSGELFINNWEMNVSIGGEEITDFERISFELDDSSNIIFHSENISLLTDKVSGFEIIKHTESQMLKMRLVLGEGTLLLDDHLFEIKGSNILNIALLPQDQGQNFYIDNTKARFYGLTNFARLNTEDIIISDFEYWIKVEPEKLNAYAVVILVILTGWYAWSTRSALDDERKNRKITAIEKKLENVYSPMDEAVTEFKLESEKILAELGAEDDVPVKIKEIFEKLTENLLGVKRHYGHLIDFDIINSHQDVWNLYLSLDKTTDREKLDDFIDTINVFGKDIIIKISKYKTEIEDIQES